MGTPGPPAGDDLPEVAVITMARDEGEMLGRWVRHYAGQVGVTNVFVVDDHSVDGSTEGLPCQVLRMPYFTKFSFERTRMTVLSGLAASLLAAYDAVLFADCDEFVIADPAVHPSLRHFVRARPGEPALGVLGLNVVHLVGREPPLDPGQPLLGQRRFAKFLPLMCKPSLKWQPADWVLASHGIRCPFRIDPELFMFHMKFADRDHLEQSSGHRHAMFTSERRAARTSWERPPEDMVGMLEQLGAGADPDRAPVFRPPPDLLARSVQQQDDQVWRAVGAGQVKAMTKRPLVRIPDRFLGLV